jgi:Zn finger protein HypA/HybF involved in hydrogenase expression
MEKMISLACWECNAIYAADEKKPECPNCGWKPTKLVRLSDGILADPERICDAQGRMIAS